MADLSSSGDPDVDAAFGGTASAPEHAPEAIRTGDPDVDAVIDTLGTNPPQEAVPGTHPGPHGVRLMPTGEIYRGTPAQKAMLRYSRPSPDNVANIIAGKVAGGMGSSIAKAGAGIAGIGDILTGQGVDKAVSDIRQTTARNPGYVNHAQTPTASVTEQAMDSPYNPMNWVPEGFQLAGKGAKKGSEALGAGPELSGAIGQGIAEAGPWGLGLAVSRMGKKGAEESGSPMTESGESISAARSGPDITKASPELQAAYARMGPVKANDPVLARHLQGDSLPVPVKLTEGQATGDPAILSDEMNNRGATGLDKVLNEQEGALKENLTAIRDQVGPDVFSTNPVEHGDTLIAAYKAKDAPVVADISAKYKALEDANGGSFPVDGVTFANNAEAMLRKKLKSDYVPPAIARQLERYKAGEPMTFEEFEALRTNLAEEMRTAARAGNGNVKMASGIVRDALEDLPLTGDAAALKPLADAARSAAKARFDALKADPAYEAAVSGDVPPDSFVRKFVTGQGATRDGVARMRANLAGDPAALQTMSVAAVDDLREAAGISRDGAGKFGQARFNKRLENLSPKLPSLLPPDAAEHLTNLGDVARYIKERPAGATVNESGTLSGAIAQAAGRGAASVLNVKTGGLAGPVIEHISGKMDRNALQRKFNRATAPLAGVKPQ